MRIEYSFSSHGIRSNLVHKTKALTECLTKEKTENFQFPINNEKCQHFHETLFFNNFFNRQSFFQPNKLHFLIDYHGDHWHAAPMVTCSARVLPYL